MKKSALVGLAVGVTFLSWASFAAAEVQRFAIIIGANVGEPTEPQLRYAERDAQRMADVLHQLGRVPVENQVLLLGEDATTVDRVFVDINARIANYRATNPNGDALLLVFYSGHADPRGIHLAGSRLEFKRLKSHLTHSPANLRVLIVDACRSGSVTRVKGGQPTQPFKINVQSALEGEGMAIITSSAAGEDAQESERLKGSFFTHHLVSGLLGAADTSGDKRVTLGEAYGYAYNETIRSTSRVARFVQHPTYDFQIRGRQDLVLTALEHRARAMGQMTLHDGGSYIVFQDDANGPVVAEFSVEPGKEVSIRQGRYLVRRRGSGAVYEQQFQVTANAPVEVHSSNMHRIPYGHLVRKGLPNTDASALGMVAGAGISSPIIPDTGELFIGLVGVQVDFAWLSLQARLRYGQSEHNNAFIDGQQSLLGGGVSVLKMFDWRDAAFGFGFGFGVDRLSQDLNTPGLANDRTSWSGGGGLVLRLTYAPLPWLTLYAEGNGDAQVVELESSTDPNASDLSARFVPHASGGLVLYLF